MFAAQFSLLDHFLAPYDTVLATEKEQPCHTTIVSNSDSLGHAWEQFGTR